jgi:hypothetical protein
MKISFILLCLFYSCQSETDKTTIADQKKTIDSLEIELNDYKILHSVAKEIIEKDSILLK